MRPTRWLDAVLLAVAAVWGSSYLAAKVATSAAPVADVLLVRYGLAAVVCVLIVLARPDRRWTRDEVCVGCLLGVTLAAVLIVETTGVARTSAANAGVIISLTIVMTPVLEAGRGRRLPPSFFGAAGVCVAGVTLLVCGSGLSRPGAGDALMVLAAVIRAVHLVLVARLTAGRSVRPLHLTAVQMLVGPALCACGAAGQLARLSAVGAADGLRCCTWRCCAASSRSWRRPGRPSARRRAGPACCWAPSRSGRWLRAWSWAASDCPWPPWWARCW